MVTSACGDRARFGSTSAGGRPVSKMRRTIASARGPRPVPSCAGRAICAIDERARKLLVEQRKRRELCIQQESLVVSLRDATRLSDIRYRGGVAAYLEVLDNERQLFDAELLLAQAQRDELLSVVQLYKALGGGWAQ